MGAGLYQRQHCRVELRVVGAPAGEIAGRRAVVHDLAGEGLDQQRVALDAAEDRQQVGAGAGCAEGAPEGEGVVLVEAGQERSEAAGQRAAVRRLQLRRVEAGGDQDVIRMRERET